MAKREPAPELRPTGRRLESFSDAVFAIVITIMVLEIHIPDSLALVSDPAALRTFGANFVTYMLSFFVIANLWTSHHYLTFTVQMPTRGTIWFNNLLLFCISMIPIATPFLGKFPTSPRAAAAYGFVGAACTGAFMLLRSHARRRSHNPAHREIHGRILRKSAIFLAIYVVSVPLAFVSPLLAWACFLAVPPMLFLPTVRAAAKPPPASPEHMMQHSCP
jgi:uncharacterized membrane protein